MSCGALWVVAKGLKIGDVVICPDGQGSYKVGEIAGDYEYVLDGILPHRRRVNWLDVVIPRSAMSEAFEELLWIDWHISRHHWVCRRNRGPLLGASRAPRIIATDESIEDPSAFAMESHLEDFLVAKLEPDDLRI